MSEAPKVFVVYVPSLHPFARMTVKQFEALFGPNIGRVIQQVMPVPSEGMANHDF